MEKISSNSFDEFEIFPWNDNLVISHEKIDEQHKSLVDLLNQLAKSLVNDDEVQIDEAFKKMADYAVYHFKTEEEYWKTYLGDDPWVSAHKEIHDSFLPHVTEIRTKSSKESIDEIIEDIVKFLTRWLAFHIIDSDKRMSIVVTEIRNGKSREEAKDLSRNKLNGSLKDLTDTILLMYDGLSGNAIKLMKERRIRIRAEKALKMANDNLEKASITDALTGLFNRRHFNNIGQREFKRAVRDRIPLGFIMLDIDHFKLVNDSKGHQEGDRVLERLGKIINESCRRPGDFAFRMGGEEFAVLLVNQELDGVEMLAESIRIRFRREEDITVSCGVVGSIPEKNERIEDLVSEADKMMYKAKGAGRNRTVASSYPHYSGAGPTEAPPST